MSKEIPPKLVDDLLTYYTKIKAEFYLQRYEAALIKSGKFCETVFQILYYLVTGKVITNPVFTKISPVLEKSPSSKFPESIRLLIPRITKATYDIRSKRGAAHKKEAISPNQMDCDLVVAQCDWILSEFLRLYHDSNVEEIKQVIKEIFKRKVLVVEQFEEDVLVLNERLSVRNQILTILWYFYPKPVLVEDLKKWVHGSTQNISASINYAKSKRLVFRRDNRVYMTEKGLKYIEDYLKSK